jgi:type IV fimbrial biogenesis protein FimT
MKNNTGFTLIELIIALLISAILLGMAVPSVQSMLARNRLFSSYNTFVSAIRFTRSEAIKRGDFTHLCKWNPVTEQCDHNRSWNQGWAVLNANDELIRVYDDLPKTIDMIYAKNQVRFSAQGFAPGFAGSIVFCSNETVGVLGAVITLIGQVRVSEPSVSECSNG